MGRVGRRQFLVAAGALLAAPLVADAQQPAKVHRIGFLSFVSLTPSVSHIIDGAFRRGLRDLGYVEGENLIVEWRWAEGRVDRLHDLAAELVRQKVELIVAGAAPVPHAAQKATRTIPIVFAVVADPVTNAASPFTRCILWPNLSCQWYQTVLFQNYPFQRILDGIYNRHQ